MTLSKTTLFVGYCASVDSLEVARKIQGLFEKSGPFDYLFLFGSFDDSSLAVFRQLENCNVCIIGKEHDGFIKLSSGSITTFENGLQVALCLSGSDSSMNSLTGPVDILLSDLPPQSIKGSQSSQRVRRVLSKLQPRYHITSFEGSKFFEQEPYENLDDSGSFMFPSRFLSLGSALSDEKWIYAVNITPLKHEEKAALAAKPANLAPSPYATIVDESAEPNFFFQTLGGSAKRSIETKAEPSKKPRDGYICKRCHSDQHFFKDCPHADSSDRPKYVCHICHEPGHKIQNCPKKTERGTLDKSAPDSCWFCLSNPAIRKHLIAHIGDEIYVTLAKGGLVPEHFLIIPIEHHGSNTALTSSMLTEVTALLKSISTGTDGPLFVWCHRHNPGHHLHLQVISLASSKREDLVSFIEECSATKEHPLVRSEAPLSRDLNGFNALLFHGGKIAQEWTCEVPAGEYFPASFGRELIANYLNLAERIDWRLSPLTEKEETDLVLGFKQTITFG